MKVAIAVAVCLASPLAWGHTFPPVRPVVSVRRKVALTVAVVTPVLAAGGYAVAWLVSHWAAVLVALVALALVLRLRPSHRAICPGLHCGGCKR